MNKRIGIASLFGLLLALLPVSIASAHVLQVDGTIGAVLHINPDDNPVSATPTDYVLAFDDSSGKFSLPKCTCRVIISSGSHTVSNQPLAVTNNQTSNDTTTFPKPAVYLVQIVGHPKPPGTFQSFALNYTVRVTGGQATMQPFPPLLWLGMGLVIGLILLAAYAMEYTGNKSENEGKA